MDDENDMPVDFQKNWRELIQSLDVRPEKAKEMEQLPLDQKQHLLESYYMTIPKCSAFHCVTSIKGLRVNRSTLPKSRRAVDGQKIEDVLSVAEISLRTNHVGWVYDFIQHDGVNVLVDYVDRTVRLILSSKRRASDDSHLRPRFHTEDHSSSHYDALTLSDDASSSSLLSSLHPFGCMRSHRPSKRSLDTVVSSTSKKALLGGLHQAVKCFRALLNNQRGCSVVLDHRTALNAITMCLIHPSYQTKILILELLTAVCLIVSGHERVIEGFDYFKKRLGEFSRFETLVEWFATYQWDFTDGKCNDDFIFTCVRFFNIVAHSTTDIMLRVFLQEELRHLGVMELAHRLLPQASDRLTEQINVFDGNEVNVETLLDESQHREFYQQECEARDAEILALQTRLGTLQSQNEAQTAELRAAVTSLQARCSELEGQLEKQTKPSADDKPKVPPSKPEKESETSSSGHGDSITSDSISLVSPPPPPPVPPPPPGSIPPPPGLSIPPPPPGSRPDAVPIRPPIQTRFKLPVINWTTLTDRQVRGTIFVKMNDEEVLNHVDWERFEEIFKLSNQAMSRGRSIQNGLDLGAGRGAKKPEKKSLMDPNRHRCIGVLLRFLESEKGTVERLYTDINNLHVSQDVADRIYHQLPTQDERRTYLKYEFTDQLDVTALTDEDQLLLRLCKIDRLGPRLELVLFMNSFEDSVSSLFSRLSAVRDASLAVRNSERFRAILEIVLAFGNYINSSRRGIVYGFRLQSLEALSETRSPDKSWTLLHYMVETIQTELPHLATFYEDFGSVTAASKVPAEVLTGDVNALVAGFNLADSEAITYGPENTPARLTEFIATNRFRIESMKQLADVAKNEFSQTIEYFGELRGKSGPDQFFGLLSRFIDNFKKALADNTRRRETEALRAIQLATKATDSSAIPTGLPCPSSKKPKDRHLAHEARLAKRRMANRTRQITSDGIMDDILAGLESEPLQAEVHPRRFRQSEEVFG